jgi:hypothetical protein
MIITCPFSVGKSKAVKCIHGDINDERCPYYQRESKVTSIDRLLDLQWTSISEIGRFYNEIQEDFWNIGEYIWSCVHYPEINSGSTEIKLYGKDGKYWSIEEVMLKYTNEYYKKIEVEDEGNNKPENDDSGQLSYR